MRGPLFSGAVGSSAVLERLSALVEGKQPVVVLSAIWLAEILARTTPVCLVVEPHRARAARRARKRVARARARLERRSARSQPVRDAAGQTPADSGFDLQVAVAGEELPLRSKSVSAVVVESLGELALEDGQAYVRALAPLLQPGGYFIALDRTRDPRLQARLCGHFLSGCLVSIGQERPKEGAVITIGLAPPSDVLHGPSDGLAKVSSPLKGPAADFGVRA